MKFSIFCVLVFGILLTRAEFPASIPKCKNGDEACFVRVGNEILQKYYAGQKDINLLSLDPLHVKKIVLERNANSPVNIDISFSDVDVFGLKNMIFSSLKGFSSDLSGRNVLEAKIPEVRFVGKYKVDGRVLVLPVVGEGPCEVKMKNLIFKFAFDLKPVEKGGKTYATLEHVKLDVIPEHVHFQFDNLFNGDKVLGDNMNVFINENWSDIFNEIKPSFNKALSLVVKSRISSVFEKLPYAEYFE